MKIIEKYVKKYAAARRGEFISQTTTRMLDGQNVYRHVPEANISVFPVLSFRSLFSFLDDKPKNVYDHGYAKIPVIAARYAIAHALEQIQMSPGAEILIPAYHCTVMIEPIIKMGGKPVFYKITPSLDTDINDVHKKITPRTQAIIAVNYCGFIQNMAEVSILCQKKNLILIEDCAHSFFGQKNDVTVGGHGDYILVSARKFFPVNEGGVLLIRDIPQNLPQQRKPNFVISLKSFLTLIERSLKFERLWLLIPVIELFNFFKRVFKNHTKKNIESNQLSHHSSEIGIIQEGENTYNHHMINKKPAFVDSLLPAFLNSVNITQCRRKYYLWLSNEFKKMPNCKLIIDHLSDGIVPFMLPVYIENLEKYFPAFEDAAIPMQRFAQFLWPDVTAETCPVSADYSKNVILFPCHQELSQQDIQWLASTVRHILEQSE